MKRLKFVLQTGKCQLETVYYDYERDCVQPKKTNPYKQWLKISSYVDDIPNDYQLLGVADFESDPEYISAACDSRIEMLTQMQVKGPDAAFVPRLIRQIEAARDNLMDEQSKARYDHYLVSTARAGLPHLGWLGSLGMFASFAGSIVLVIVATFYIYPMVIAKEPEPIGASVTTLPDYVSPEEQLKIQSEQKDNNTITAININASIPIVDDFQTPLAEPTELVPAVAEQPQLDTPAESVPADTIPVDESAQKGAPNAPAVPSDSAVVVPPQLPVISAPGELTDAPNAEPIPTSTQSAPSDSNQTDSTSNTAAGLVKTAVPSEEKLTALLAQIRQENELSSPCSASVYQEKAKQLLVKASDSNIDSALRFALLQSAVEQAALAADGQLVLRAINAQNIQFEINGAESITNALIQCTQSVSTPVQAGNVLAAAQTAENQLIEQNDYANALKIAAAVYQACSKPAVKQYRISALSRKNEIDVLSKRWTDVQDAQAKINQTDSPSDSADIIAAWKYEIDKDWSAALPYLTRSNDERTRIAAQKEIVADDSNQGECIAVADAWWNIAQDPIPMQKSFKTHAAVWYKKALPFVSDKQTKTLIEKRISISEQE